MSWPETEFENLYEIPSKNGLTRPSRVRGSGYKMINMGELFANDRIGSIDMELVPMNDKELSQMLVEKGDLLFARQSLVLAGAGKCSIVKDVDQPTTFESHIIRVRLKKKLSNSKFYYYYFKSPSCRIKSIVTQGVQAGIRGNDLKKLSVHSPPLEVQDKISELLEKYDDLIENNKRRIELLEESARQLYKEWFVRFRFPGHEHVKIIDGVPEGWEEIKVSEVVKRFPPGKLYSQKTALPKGLIPILDQGRSGLIGYHNNKPSFEASVDHPVIIFANHTCYQRIIHHPFSAIQNVLPYKSSEQYDLNIYWLHHATEGLVRLAGYKGHWPEFMAKKIIIPPKLLCQQFGELARDSHLLKFSLEQQNQKLVDARDILLPKLMNGEITV